MLSELLNGPRAIGLKQSQRAVKEGKALGAWVAEDAEPHVIRPFLALCQQNGVPVHPVASMGELGAACGIDVGAAVAVSLQP